MFKWIFSICFCVTFQVVFAGNELFSTSIKIKNQENQEIFIKTEKYTSLDNLIDSAMQSNLIGISDYDQQVSKVDITMSIRGLSSTIEYKAEKYTGAAGEDRYDTRLTFKIGDIAVNENFCAKEVVINNQKRCTSTRVDNENKFRDYVEDNRDGIQNKIAKYLVETDAFEPVTGPDGLIPTMATEDFSNATELARGSDSESGGSSYGSGLAAGYFCTDDHCQSLITLPLNYTHYFSESGKKLKLSAPISYINVDGSKAFKGNFGASLTQPMSKKWTIIPSFRLGVVGSADMGSSATIASLSLSNIYNFPYKSKHISFANMIGFQKSLDVKLGDLESPYDLNTQVMKNGISIEFPQRYTMLGGKTSIEASLANTQFFGEDLYIKNTTDIAVSIGTRRKLGKTDKYEDGMHLGITYTLGEHGYQGGKFNFGYKF